MKFIKKWISKQTIKTIKTKPYYVPIANVQNIYNVIGREVCNIGHYFVLLI